MVTDQDGVLTLIVPTDGVTRYTFSLTSTDDASGSDGAFSIDPTLKVFDALSKIRDGDDLKNAKTQTGLPLLQNTKLSDNDIDQTAKAMNAAVGARVNVKVKQGLLAESKAAGSRGKVRFKNNMEKLEGSPRGILDLPAVSGVTVSIVILSSLVTLCDRLHGIGLLALSMKPWDGPPTPSISSCGWEKMSIALLWTRSR